MTFQEQYEHEWEQKERLRAAIGIPLGLLIAIGSLLGVMLQSFWWEPGILCYFFWAAALGSSIFFARTMYCLVRSYHGHTYKAIPFALERWKYREDLRDWHSKYGKGPQDGDKEYDEILEHQYAEAADHNATANLIRSEYLFRANGAVVSCVIAIVVTFIPFAVHRVMTPPAVQKVEIVNRATVATDTDKNMSTNNPKPASPPPPKPTAPPLRDIKEGQIPVKKR